MLVVDFLNSPGAHGGAMVERVETHSSIVFLAGDRALKLKRAVRYDYLDYSTPERRREACEAEVRLNRRTAPSIYRGVLPVTREADGRLALGGAGTPIDWVVEMTRFDQTLLLDRLAARDALDPDLMPPLAAAIARFHRDAERRPDHGGRAGMRWVVDGNDAGFAEQGAGLLDPDECAAVTAAARAAVDRHGDWLDVRRRSGFVRHGHGDLHLRNLVLLDGVPTLFDGVEFNDEIACTDVWYDLAFLLMDLWQRELPRHANVVFNTYLEASGDPGGLPVLPLFLSCRAAVRAKTSATASRIAGAGSPAAEPLGREARRYLALARRLLHPPAARIVAIGGLSGSGKSTLARLIAPAVGPAPGAVLLRSDEIRKRLCGVGPLERLGPEGYTADVDARVYGELAARARAAVEGGHAAIVDAVFARADDRAAIERAAGEAGAPFAGLWLDAPADVLIARVGARTHDASDADAAVVRAQIARPTGPIAWRRLDAAGDWSAWGDWGQFLDRSLD